MAHTPGPWRVGPEDWILSKQHGMGWRQFPVRGKDYDVANVFCDEDDAEQAANLRLIAAAPDLLAALKLLRNPDGDGKWVCYCDDPHYEGGMCENCVATAAIDKAEGRSE